MKATTTVRLPMSPYMKKRAQVEAILAMVNPPWNATALVQVRIETIRMVNILGQGGRPPYKVASCSVSPACLPFDVPLDKLLRLSAIISMEVT